MGQFQEDRIREWISFKMISKRRKWDSFKMIYKFRKWQSIQ